MEKITDKIAALPAGSDYFSLEFFPPKTQIGFSNLQTRLERMSTAFRPLFVTVTWGAGGITASRSLELAEICQRQLGLTTCLHLTCTNMRREVVDQALEEAKILGVRNILALRGDPPRDKEYRIENGTEEEEGSNADFTWAVDLVRYIRQKYGDYFCVGVAGYPEGHSDLSHPDDQDINKDVSYLVEKTRAGADFIMTQLFYDVKAFEQYQKLLRGHDSGAFKTIPIIPGLMPIQNYGTLTRVAKLSHAKIPPLLLERLEPLKADDEAVKNAGVNVLTEIVQSIQLVPSSVPRGFHFYTLNLEKVVGDILDRCKLIPTVAANDSAIADSPFQNGIHPELEMRDRALSTSSSAAAQLTTDSHRSMSPRRLSGSKPSPNLLPFPQDAVKDEFPNGRFGDARSPAFNAPLTYSMTSFNVSPPEALHLWGAPTSPTEITTLFTSHLNSSHPPRLPWSETTSLSPETQLIKDSLTSLTTALNFWTLASQPSVNGQLSTHPIHGWGPPGGFVFQKAFVEFFVPTQIFNTSLKAKLQRLAGEGEVAWYAVTASGSFESSESSEAVHAVTWGSFKGKEIVTATMVEEMSFRAWGEEAFGIWGEWGRCVGELARGMREGDEGKGRLRQCREFLMGMRGGTVLVNVIGHAFVEEGRLWDVLLKS